MEILEQILSRQNWLVIFTTTAEMYVAAAL